MWHLVSKHTEEELRNWGLKKDVLRTQAECLTAARQTRLVTEKKRQQKLRSKEKERVKAMLKHSPESVEIAELYARQEEHRQLIRSRDKKDKDIYKQIRSRDKMNKNLGRMGR